MHFMVACVQIGCSIFERKLIFLKCLFPWIVYKVDLQLIWYIYQETLRYQDWKIHRGTYCNVANRPLIMMLNHFKVCFIAFSHNPKRQTPSSVSIFLCLPRSSEIGWGQKWIGPQKKLSSFTYLREGFFYYQLLKLTSLFSDVHGTLHVSLLETVNRRISARYFCL